MVIRDGVVVSYHTCNGGTTWAHAFLARALGPTFVSDPFNGRPADDVLLREVCESFSSQLYLFSLSEWGYSQLSPGIVIEPLLNAPVRVRRDAQLLVQGEGGLPADAKTEAKTEDLDLDLALLPAEDLKVRLCQVVLTVNPLPSS